MRGRARLGNAGNEAWGQLNEELDNSTVNLGVVRGTGKGELRNTVENQSHRRNLQWGIRRERGQERTNDGDRKQRVVSWTMRGLENVGKKLPLSLGASLVCHFSPTQQLCCPTSFVTGSMIWGLSSERIPPYLALPEKVHNLRGVSVCKSQTTVGLQRCPELWNEFLLYTMQRRNEATGLWERKPTKYVWARKK